MNTEDSLVGISPMTDDNQYKGDLFPEEFPFNYDRLFDYRYFWMKYYISQRLFVAIPKK